MATDWKKFEQNNKTIEKYDGEKYNYLALKSITAADGFNRPIRSLSRLLCGITSNHNGDFYCLGCFHSFCCNDSLKNMKDSVVNMITVMLKRQKEIKKY